jgi:hypothetical protein
MQAIVCLMVLFATVLCAVPVSLTFIEVRRLRKELSETQRSTQPALATKRARPSLCPTAEAVAGFRVIAGLN